ncbi:MAG: transcription-repair coupling factor [Candidatus Kapaibacteriota bacterium]
MKKSIRNSKIHKIIQNNPKFLHILNLFNSKNQVKIKGLKGSLKAILLEQIYLETNANIIILTNDKKAAEEFYNDLKINLGEDLISLILKPEKHRTVSIESSFDNLGWITSGLEKIIKSQSLITITTKEIISEKIPSNDNFTLNHITIHKSQRLDYTDFVRSLLLSGFDKVDFVSNEGEISVRGGVIDIFPIGFQNPIRVEFWGNDIDSIREFNILSQRSIKSMEKVEFLAKNFHNDNTELNSSIFNFIKEDCIIVIDEPDLLHLSELDFDIDDKLSKFKQIIFNPVTEADVKIKSEEQPRFSSSIKNLTNDLIEKINLTNEVVLCAEGEIHVKRFKELVEDFLEGDFAQLTKIIETSTNDTINRTNYKEKFFEHSIWLNQTYSNGFYSSDFNLSVYTEHQVFDRLRFQTRVKKEKSSAIALKEIKELKYGDYVVHEDKGIARFEGFKTVKIGGSEQDCIRLAFAEGDVLYVNLNYIQKIQKYSSESTAGISLSKLGSSEWSRKKERTKKKLKDIARDLIKLYAARKMQKGFAFHTDNVWQKEFEASFTFEDTIDQARATQEVKIDMESEVPMDRLVCGDVGFGKTEIAVRAAFKAVQSGKQVAVLVPTTVLAQQHYMTFKDRISHYPVNIEVMSRFRTQKEQTQVVENLKLGRVDILIGTHRLLSKDIEFKDLGLLVIDEEQRFGVSAKEKLRQLKASIDTLTLTATPIPRTLNFSLMGARDMSVIETPPRNRLPVVTEILEWEDEVISNAIFNEIERGGQIFFVNDRVEDLPKIEMQLKMLLPRCKFGIAHGQMKPKELENVMQKFIAHDIDVLLTTKIVESGLDIPNANTILINRAYNFGLAELYQLRGRVGRSNTQAYCYLLLEKNKKLNNTAIQRLQAIEEFTDLGSGFQLALKDMEIRGVGNLLGAEQSGEIYDIGFEMYQKILEEAVHELKEQEFRNVFKLEAKSVLETYLNEEVAIEIGSDALLPIAYIKSDTERFEYYKKLYSVKNNIELKQVTEELEDKYGKMPQEGNDLLFAIKLRIAAIYTGFEKVTVTTQKLICELPPNTKKDYYEVVFPVLSDYISSIQNSRLYQNNNKLYWEVKLTSRENATEILWKIRKTMELID